MVKSSPTELDSNDIKRLIPHRYPMLLVDRIVDIVEGHSGTGLKAVTNNEPFFQGHFPDFPIMPGVLIVEAMVQTAGALVCHSLPEAIDRQVLFMSIEQARFRKPVVPGHLLEMKVLNLKSRQTVWKFQGEAFVGNQLHAEATFTAMVSGRT